MTSTPTQLNEQGKESFQNGEYEQAADFFQQASAGFAAAQDALSAAEAKNNLSVALLQAEKPQEALEAAAATDAIFEAAADVKRQAMALGNQAAALDALKRYDEALAAYERAADLFAQTQEGDLRALTLKSIAAIKLKTGKTSEAALRMLGSLDAKKNLTWFERALKFFLRFSK
ncbi:MAG: hypothetical protein Fur002_06830 [Anaerolineales bacterium]